MNGLLILFLLLLSTRSPDDNTVQIPDYLIIKGDTIFLRTFPLEQLNFSTRPFRYGNFSFPDSHCYRGYQATWKVIDDRLYLTHLTKIDDPGASIDMEDYFISNDYQPVVRDGAIFADWFTMNLESFPRKVKRCAYLEKVYKKKRSKPVMRFEEGVLKYNKL